jgi:hypothetical protein
MSRGTATVTGHLFGYITDCKDTALVCDLLLLSRKKNLKKGSNVWHIDKELNITENNVFFSTRAPEEIIIIYLRCMFIVTEKAIIGFVMSGCQFACTLDTARLPSYRLL